MNTDTHASSPLDFILALIFKNHNCFSPLQFTIFKGIGATWFAARIAQSFYNPMAYFNMEAQSAGRGGIGGFGGGGISDEYNSRGQRYILGRSLFIGE